MKKRVLSVCTHLALHGSAESVTSASCVSRCQVRILESSSTKCVFGWGLAVFPVKVFGRKRQEGDLLRGILYLAGCAGGRRW